MTCIEIKVFKVLYLDTARLSLALLQKSCSPKRFAEKHFL
jgi:hypothetical protein